MKQRVKVQVWTVERTARPLLCSQPVQPRLQTRFGALSAMLLTGAIGLVMGGSWLAVRLIVNPASAGWLGQILPNWGEFAAVKPQSLSQIEAEVARSGQQLGQPIHFSTYPGMTQRQAGFHHLLLPILQPIQHCASTCSQIVELRVYRPQATRSQLAYELIDRMAVTGPTELETIAPLSLTGSTRTLPLTDVNFIEGKAPAGLWLQLSGEWERGSRVRYGQVVNYDPIRSRLSLLQAWSSPAGELPDWQQVTGSPTPELVVNQSVGLEPQFRVFQLRVSRSLLQPMMLEPISLTAAALNDRSYENSLLLARNGLWSLALARLQATKQASQPASHTWSAAAQAQLDLIAMHAKITQAQAEQDWASPTQQILAQMVDCRWRQSLMALKSAAQDGYDIRSLLATNGNQLWRRVETALRVDPQADLRSWGTLILAVRQNQQQALTWLHKQPNIKPAFTQSLRPLLALLNSDSGPDASPDIAPEVAAQPPLSLVGAVTPLSVIQPQAWTPLAQPSAKTGAKPVAIPAQPPLRQSWYQIEIKSLQTGQSWQKFTQPAIKQSAAKLALEQAIAKLPLQLGVWQNAMQVQSLPLTLKATQLKQGQLLLLGLGEALPRALKPSALVAATPNVTWLQPQASLLLGELMQQPDWRAMPQLWQALTTAHLIPDPTADPVAAIGQWSVQRLALTGEQTPAAILTLEPDAGSPRTVIFSHQKLLYSDLQLPDQTVIGLVGEANRSMLLLQQGQSLALKQWSAQTQQFE